MGGFALTLWQLRQIKSAAEASKEAIENVQIKISAFDTAQECQLAQGKILEIGKAVSESRWNDVRSNYEELIRSFLRLSHSNSKIDDADRHKLRDATELMAKFCDAILKRREEDGPMPLKGQSQAIRDFSDIMTKVSFVVVRDI